MSHISKLGGLTYLNSPAPGLLRAGTASLMTCKWRISKYGHNPSQLYVSLPAAPASEPRLSFPLMTLLGNVDWLALSNFRSFTRSHQMRQGSLVGMFLIVVASESLEVTSSYSNSQFDDAEAQNPLAGDVCSSVHQLAGPGASPEGG